MSSYNGLVGVTCLSILQISLEEYLASPTSENLVALGDNRAQLIVDSLKGSSPGVNTDTHDRNMPMAVAEMYVKVASVYMDDCDTTVKQAVETTIGT